jgi:hypothetical protein
MTIDYVEPGEVRCVWFAGTTPQFQMFITAVLEYAP